MEHGQSEHPSLGDLRGLIEEQRGQIEELSARVGTKRSLWARKAGRRTLAVSAVSVAAALAVSGAAFASVPDSGGVIHGCYGPASGLLMLSTTSGATCHPGLTPIAWSQTGPAGAQGMQGLKGDLGAQGPQGIPGPTGSNGTTGGVGPVGPAGASGTSDAYIARQGTDTAYSGTQLSVSVPAGSYIITAKAVASNYDNDYQNSICSLSTGDQTGIRVNGVLAQDDPMAIPLQDAATFGAQTTVTLSCSGYNTYFGQGVLTALKVGTIHA